VILPTFRSAQSLPELHRQVAPALDESGEDWELILVDDVSVMMRGGTQRYRIEITSF
jgi:hypothetical protein